MDICLTRAELVNLTDYKHRKKQVQVLVRMGIPFRLTPAGEIKVVRSDVDLVRDSGEEEAQPDYGAI